MKIAFFDTKPYDKEIFDLVNTKFGYDLKYFKIIFRQIESWSLAIESRSSITPASNFDKNSGRTAMRPTRAAKKQQLLDFFEQQNPLLLHLLGGRLNLEHKEQRPTGKRASRMLPACSRTAPCIISAKRNIKIVSVCAFRLFQRFC
ncbi:MAG: hypothetical protein HC905_10630 [Bacteroidales bacterium]|nr:hypothetical protein [Bacteroidales bacterium]